MSCGASKARPQLTSFSHPDCHRRCQIFTDSGAASLIQASRTYQLAGIKLNLAWLGTGLGQNQCMKDCLAYTLRDDACGDEAFSINENRKKRADLPPVGSFTLPRRNLFVVGTRPTALSISEDFCRSVSPFTQADIPCPANLPPDANLPLSHEPKKALPGTKVGLLSTRL